MEYVVPFVLPRELTSSQPIKRSSHGDNSPELIGYRMASGLADDFCFIDELGEVLPFGVAQKPLQFVGDLLIARVTFPGN